MRLFGDIDIDSGNREKILSLIEHIPASTHSTDSIKAHPSGIYVTDIPIDSEKNLCSMDYEEAEKRGYFKLDLLNVFVYQEISNESHLIRLMEKEPDWQELNNPKIVEQLIHLANQYDYIKRMPEPIDSLEKLAMFLAIIRPAKRHLLGKTWEEIRKTVWEKEDDGYQFRKAHAISYAQLVMVHMNLLKEKQ